MNHLKVMRQWLEVFFTTALAVSLIVGCMPDSLPDPTAEISAKDTIESRSPDFPIPTTSSPTAPVVPQLIPTSPEPTFSYPPPERNVYSLAKRLKPDYARKDTSPVNPEYTPVLKGQTQTFWVTDLVHRRVDKIDAVLAQISPNAYWYFEKENLPASGQLNKAVQTFEEVIYPAVTKVFGVESRPGIDGDPHITILHAGFAGADGYFSSIDEYPKEIFPFSNEREMIYMSSRGLLLGSDAYLGTLAHELQHAIHWAADSTEDTWINEGLAELAKNIAGFPYSFIDYFAASPSVSLTNWATNQPHIAAKYGAATLFIAYLTEHYGGTDSLEDLLNIPENGIRGVSTYFEAILPDQYQSLTFVDVFKDWLLANYLDPFELDGYSYNSLNIQVDVDKVITGVGIYPQRTPQYAGEYVEIQMDEGNFLLSFEGQIATQILPTTAHSGSHCWWGNRGDGINSSLTREIDLSGVSSANLHYWVWYDIEEAWDFSYVEISEDGGRTWTVLPTLHTNETDPLGISFGPGYSGTSDGWIRDTVDLTGYTGSKVLLRFEYITDEALNNSGICFDDISIPEIGFLDDAESEGEWNPLGFVRIYNQTPQNYLVQVVELGTDITIRQLPVGDQGNGSLEISGLGDSIDKVLVVVSPIATGTAESSSYSLHVQFSP